MIDFFRFINDLLAPGYTAKFQIKLFYTVKKLVAQNCCANVSGYFIESLVHAAINFLLLKSSFSTLIVFAAALKFHTFYRFSFPSNNDKIKISPMQRPQ